MDDDGKAGHRDDVHGLIPGQKAVLDDVGRDGGLNGPDGVQDARQDQHQNTQDQHRRQAPAHNVHHTGGADGQQKDHSKKQNGEGEQVQLIRQRLDGHFIGGGGGTGGRDEYAGAQNGRRVQHRAGSGAHRFLHGPDAAAAVEHGVNPHTGEDLHEKKAEETGDPLASAGHAQIGRKDQVSSPKEHSEQRKAGDKNAACTHE